MSASLTIPTYWVPWLEAFGYFAMMYVSLVLTRYEFNRMIQKNRAYILEHQCWDKLNWFQRKWNRIHPTENRFL